MSVSPLYLLEWVQKNKIHRAITLLFVFAIGLALTMVPNGHYYSNGLQNLGISLTTSALIALFFDIFILPNERGEILSVVDNMIAKSGLVRPAGLAIASNERGECSHYNSWIWSSRPCEVNIYGISVLHSIDRDLSKNFGTTACNKIVDRLCDGVRLRILFLNPTSELVSRIAQAQDQPIDHIIADLKQSFRIVKEIHDSLYKVSREDYELLIGVYDDYPPFSLHTVDEEGFIGFYARAHIGRNSPLYRITCDVSKVYFNQHFSDLSRSSNNTWLLKKKPFHTQPQFNFEAYDRIFSQLNTMC